jgi:hypothetical protein
MLSLPCTRLGARAGEHGPSPTCVGTLSPAHMHAAFSPKYVMCEHRSLCVCAIPPPCVYECVPPLARVICAHSSPAHVSMLYIPSHVCICVHTHPHLCLCFHVSHSPPHVCLCTLALTVCIRMHSHGPCRYVYVCTLDPHMCI